MERRTYYVIPKEDLLRLLESKLRLTALENGGVDNWTWYGDSLQDFLEESKAEDSLASFIRDMEDEGNIGYDDDFDYQDLAKWELGNYTDYEVR